MNIIERKQNDVTVLDLDGNLALEGNTEFRNCVAATINAGARKLIVNMARVSYMDSRGLDELIFCYATLYRMGGRLKLLHPNGSLKHLLDVTKLKAILETFDSEPAAVASFS